MSEEIEKAQAEFRRCSERIRKGLSTNEGGQGAEAAYSQAWTQLVRLGQEMPLKKKYR